MSLVELGHKNPPLNTDAKADAREALVSGQKGL
jgi:hypothetical protein